MKNKKLSIFTGILGVSMGTSLVILNNINDNANSGNTVEELKSITMKNNQNLNEYDIKTLKSTYLVDVENLSEVVQDGDITFVARVDSIEDTEYRHPVEFFNKNNEVEKVVYSPYTNYTITVLENIKSVLPIGETLRVTKAGGLDQDQEFIEVYEGDVLPEVSKVYVFTCYIQDDGSILIAGMNSNNVIKTETINTIDELLVSDKKKSKIENALNNDVVVEEYNHIALKDNTSEEELKNTMNLIDENKVFVD